LFDRSLHLKPIWSPDWSFSPGKRHFYRRLSLHARFVVDIGFLEPARHTIVLPETVREPSLDTTTQSVWTVGGSNDESHTPDVLGKRRWLSIGPVACYGSTQHQG